MKYFLNAVLVGLVLLFSACSSRSYVDINSKINSISLDKNVTIGDVPKTVSSPVSIGLGIGRYFGPFGMSVGTSVTPRVENEDALQLQQAINVNNLSFSNLISSEFDIQMKNDDYYKNKYTPFGANFTIGLFVPEYYLDGEWFSSKSAIKIVLNAVIYNKSGDVIYEDSQIGSSEQLIEDNELLNSTETLKNSLNSAIANAVSKIIYNMKTY